MGRRMRSLSMRAAAAYEPTSMILPFGKPPPRAMSSVRAPLGMVSLSAWYKLI